MILRAPLLVASILALPLFISPTPTYAQDINSLKAGVVRIENSRFADEVGSGFIVNIGGGSVYIVTAAHVVKGAQNHRVFLHTKPHESVSAEVLDRQLDDTKGLALLLLKANARTVSGLTALRFGPTDNLGNGEGVKVIGFPGTSIWTVESSSIRRKEGSDLVLSGQIRGGNSGGPVILN
jgi:S1-C subfamily serine protease